MFSGGTKNGSAGYFTGLPYPLAANINAAAGALSDTDIVDKGIVVPYSNGNIYLSNNDFTGGGVHSACFSYITD
jgi:hypothetical protein